MGTSAKRWVVQRARPSSPNYPTYPFSTSTPKIKHATPVNKIEQHTYSIKPKPIWPMPTGCLDFPSFAKISHLMTFALKNDVKCSIIRQNTPFNIIWVTQTSPDKTQQQLTQPTSLWSILKHEILEINQLGNCSVIMRIWNTIAHIYDFREGLKHINKN